MPENVAILGGTSSIGRALAARFAEGGARVVLAGRDLAELERNAKDIGLRHAVDTRAVAFDALDFDAHEALVERLDEALRVGGAGVPLPVLAAGERLWRDEAHVVENRALYQEKFAIAERILRGRFGFRLPAGGFFLWLEVGDGEAAAVELWRHGGLKVVPGAYMGADMPDGPNPGKPYIRVALIHEAALVEAALERLAVILTNRKSL